MSTEIVDVRRGPGCLIQLLWFLFIGWWVLQFWVAVAWLFLVSILGIPLGIWMLNRVPLVVALRDPREVRYRMTQIGTGNWVYQEIGAEQYPFLVRAVYFVLVGWWLSAPSGWRWLPRLLDHHRPSGGDLDVRPWSPPSCPCNDKESRQWSPPNPLPTTCRSRRPTGWCSAAGTGRARRRGGCS